MKQNIKYPFKYPIFKIYPQISISISIPLKTCRKYTKKIFSLSFSIQFQHFLQTFQRFLENGEWSTMRTTRIERGRVEIPIVAVSLHRNLGSVNSSKDIGGGTGRPFPPPNLKTHRSRWDTFWKEESFALSFERYHGWGTVEAHRGGGKSNLFTFTVRAISSCSESGEEKRWIIAPNLSSVHFCS